MGKHYLVRIAPLAFIILFVSHCALTEEEPAFENPFDPTEDNPHFVPVETTIMGGPADDEVVDDHTVTFTWTGNEGVEEYSYRLNEPVWSDWSSVTSVTYTYLNEGNYTFEVKGRYNEAAEDDTPDSRSFEIDDVHGPALMFYPRKVEVSQDEVFSLEIMAEEVVDLTGVKIVGSFDVSYLQLQTVTVYEDGNSFFRANGGTVISFYEYDNNAGSLTISSGVATGDPASVDGTGAIASAEFKAIRSGSTEIAFSAASEMRNAENEDIPLVEMAEGVVVIE